MSSHREALARTTLLLNEEWFSGEADEATIADALAATTVRIAADMQSMSCRAGQTALITAFMLIARMGIGIELQVPNTDVIDQVAPLRRPRLVDALVELSGDLIPGAGAHTSVGEVDETFVFGAPREGHVAPVHVSASDTEAVLERRGDDLRCSGELPFGGFAAGAAAAAIALEAARGRVEQGTGLTARTPRPLPGPPVRVDLEELFPGLVAAGNADLGRLDAISGGAIVHALLFCMFRVPQFGSQIRVIEQQSADLSNVNRYSLLRASDDGIDKIAQLESTATDRIQITGVKTLFTRETADALLPLAERVVVGVDDVEARWWVAEASPAWLAIGATSNHIAQLTVHASDGPCAACVHSVTAEPAIIPTISFVSFWAGLLLACALLSATVDQKNVSIYPFALGGRSWTISVPSVANAACPVRCAASRATSPKSAR